MDKNVGRRVADWTEVEVNVSSMLIAADRATIDCYKFSFLL